MEAAIVETYANTAQTTVVSDAGGSTITVASASGFPTSGRYRIVVGSEIMLVTGGQGTTTWNVSRGQEGTSTASHTNGTPVTQVLTAGSLLQAVANPIGSLTVQGQGIFLGSHFEQSTNSLYILASTDGITWRLLQHAPLLSGVRDPSIRYDGSTWWVAYTRGSAPTSSWSLASSPDLQNWTAVVNVDCSGISDGGGAVTLAWAPEWFVDDDGSVHVFVSLGSSSTVMQIYEQHPTNAAMTTWSTAVKVTGTSLPADMIDPFCIKSSGTYYLFYKNDATGQKYTEVMTSTSLTSGYTVQGSGHWMSSWPVVSGNGWEGFSLVQVASNTWYAYVDSTDVSDNGLGYQYSVYTGSAGAGWLTGANWAAPANTTDPFTRRHGTVLRVQDVPALRNMLASSMSKPRNPLTIAQLTSTFGCTNNATVPVTWNSTAGDDEGLWSAGSATKITAKTTGWYYLTAWVHFDANSTGSRIANFRLNGSTYFGWVEYLPSAALSDPGLVLVQFAYLHAGDYVELTVFQNSGATLNLTAGNFSAAAWT